MPKFSVIIPIYNVEKYLKQCIDSVLNQTYTDFEVILVDDGSPDGCPQICDEYKEKDNRVRVIHKKNAGVSLARQDGILISTGEYLAFVDADDRITDNYFEVVSEHTDVDIIRFGCIVEHPNGRSTTRLPKEREGIYEKCDIEKEIFPYLIQSEYAKYYCPSLWRHVFKRELFIDNMLKGKVITIGEDAACVIPCVYHAQTMFCVHKCLYIYNYNETSATKGRKTYPWDGPKLIAEHLHERMDLLRCDLQQQLDRKILHELFSIVVSQFNRDESYFKIVADIRKNLKTDLYSRCIKEAKLKSWSGRIMAISLKYRLFWLIKLYHIVKLSQKGKRDKS